MLHIHDISTLVIVGIVTNVAAARTARDASDRGFRVIVLADCCESVNDEVHVFAITQTLPAIGEVVRPPSALRRPGGLPSSRRSVVGT